MATHTLRGLFSAIADAIRAKTGGSAALVADDLPAAIAAISGGSAEYKSGSIEIESTYTSTTPIAIQHGLSSAPKYYACWVDDIDNSQRHYQCNAYCANAGLRYSDRKGCLGPIILTSAGNSQSSAQTITAEYGSPIPSATEIYIKTGAAQNIIPAGTKIYWEAVTW